MTIVWRNKNFDRGDFPEDPNRNADPVLIQNLQAFRKWHGSYIYPSPVSGALARFEDEDADSRHYAVGRQSDAVDVFAENPAAAFLLAVTCGLWGAVGIYTNTRYRKQAWPMLHLDCRPYGVGHSQEHLLVWHRDHNGYHYPQYEQAALDRLYSHLHSMR